MTERAISGFFAIATVAILLLNYQGVQQILSGAGGTQLPRLIKGLEGR